VDLNEYLMRHLIDARLAEVRARGDRARLLASLGPAPSRPRVAVGRALIEIGQWLAGEPSPGRRGVRSALEGRGA
jgi:hypothetical protein